MQELFEKTKSTISEHITSVFQEGELERNSTVRKFRKVQIEGTREVSRDLEYYNLDVIISVGYRVKSQRGTQFRIWATKVLREYIIKGFAMDDDRLKQASSQFGKDYFEELLGRIREIRASERRFYQKITDIYARCSFL
ncbi:RhuM family protein [Marivirga tractuosa]|uniref:RhuM family protein n=1 Tax=Marivirga tractuosa TaxID=1006 RepID=UPI0035CF0398